MAADINNVKRDVEQRMKKSIESLKLEFGKIRTGRAHPGLLDHLRVDYYGNTTPLSQVANIGASDARTLTVTPWDKNMVQAVEKAIKESNLGLNPAVSGTVIRVPLPALNEERRRELTKVVRTEGENARIAIRNVRRDGNQQLKGWLKEKQISQDDDKHAEGIIQELTDRFIAEVDHMVSDKEKEIMQV